MPFIYTAIYVLDEAICILLCYLKMLWYDSFIKFCRWGNMVSFILRDISFICVHKFQQGMCVLKLHYMFSWPKENDQGRPPLNHLQIPLFQFHFNGLIFQSPFIWPISPSLIWLLIWGIATYYIPLRMWGDWGSLSPSLRSWGDWGSFCEKNGSDWGSLSISLRLLGIH